MKKYFSCLVVSALVTSLAVGADEYQFDVSGSIDRTNSDYFSDDTGVGIGIQFHFVPVDTSKGPLAEAAFINKSSNIYAVQYSHDLPDSDFTLLGGEVYIPNTMFYLGMDYAYFPGTGGETAWGIKAGVTPIDGLLVTTSFYEDVDYEPNLTAKYLLPLNNGNTLVLNGNFEQSDDFGDTVRAGLDYYFSRNTGLGFNITDFDGNQENEIHITHFFTEDAYAGLSYADDDFSDTISVSGGFRF